MVCDLRMRTLILFTVIVAIYSIHQGKVKKISALEGGRAVLPCDSCTNITDDRLLLLVWYKGHTPIYSYDSRLSRHWRNDLYAKGERLTLFLETRPSTLIMDPVEPSDEAVYYCRADFAWSKSRKVAVSLRIIILPGRPFLLDEIGMKVSGKVGPYHDGDTLVLTCLVVGGKPTPSVTWWQNNELLDSSDGPSDVPLVRENQLILPLNINNGNKEIQCIAKNNDIEGPLVISVFVELYVVASSVKILSNQQPLRENQNYTLSCLVLGGHPLPQVSWELDRKRLKSVTQNSTTSGGSSLLSMVNLTVTKDYNGKNLSCIATNILMDPSRSTRLHTISLEVIYPPSMEIALESKNKLIKKGDRVVMECSVIANPAVSNITWKLNNITIENKTDMLKCNSTSCLIIEEVDRMDSGMYHCTAINSEGATSSKAINIDVLYRPECSSEILIDILKSTTITCPSAGRPPAKYFTWLLQSVGDDNCTMETASSIFDLAGHVNTSSSTMTIYCWAENSIGRQVDPCVKHLEMNSLMPPIPQLCIATFDNGTLKVDCRGKYNSSLDITYELLVWKFKEKSNKILVMEELKRGLSSWSISHLSSDWTYDVLIRTKNNFGYSKTVQFIVNQNSTAVGRLSHITLEVGLVTGLVGILGLTIILLAIVLNSFCCWKRKSIPLSQNTNTNNKDIKLENVGPLLLEKHVSNSLESSESSVSEELPPPPVITRTNKPYVDGRVLNGMKNYGQLEISAKLNHLNKESCV